MKRSIVSTFIIIMLAVLLVAIGRTINALATDGNIPVHYNSDLSQFVTEPCLVDGNPTFIGVNNYGEASYQKTITYQRTNGDIVVLMITRDLFNNFYVWATDKIMGGICPE